MSNIQLRVHRSGRETSCDWNRLGSAVHRRRFSYRFTKSNQELYEECLERTRGVEGRDITDVDQEELEEEQDPPLLEES